MVVSGTVTILQAVRVGRIGAGHILVMGTSGAFIGVCITALVEGGPATLASLVVVSSLFQFLLSARLSLLRRIVTPVVAGTVLMLIAATVMPIVFGMLGDVPEGASTPAAPLTASVTLVVVVVVSLRAPRSLQLWAPLIGVVVGCGVAAAFGMYDYQGVLDAPWIGIPDVGGWPGFQLPTEAFWALLPAFVVVTIVGAIETIGDSVAIQQVSRRRPRAGDFRLVQGALDADGVGNLLSGIAGTVPNTTYSSSISLLTITGIAARRVGVYTGLFFILLVFSPKIVALLLAIPNAVAAAYTMVLIALIFVEGFRIVMRNGMDPRKAMVVGVSFWMGVGFENKVIFPDLLTGPQGALFGNGMTTGALCAILLTVFLELTSSRRRRLAVDLEFSSFPKIDEFLREFGAKIGWNETSTDRLRSAGEETLASLLQVSRREDADPRKLTVSARLTDEMVELEFLAASEEENLEDRLAYLDEQPETPDEREISFRLLRHYASSVNHRQYHNLDVVTVQVPGSR
ncbi:MAG: purine/pyrimidine permease [Dehalococcoidia bacterium]|nr:purine/pyrimidine permease [Dehalococcoidia bacterium]